MNYVWWDNNPAYISLGIIVTEFQYPSFAENWDSFKGYRCEKILRELKNMWSIKSSGKIKTLEKDVCFVSLHVTIKSLAGIFYFYIYIFIFYIIFKI